MILIILAALALPAHADGIVTAPFGFTPLAVDVGEPLAQEGTVLTFQDCAVQVPDMDIWYSGGEPVDDEDTHDTDTCLELPWSLAFGPPDWSVTSSTYAGWAWSETGWSPAPLSQADMIIAAYADSFGGGAGCDLFIRE